MAGNPVTRRFAANLRRERTRRGLSQERLAELTDLHRTEISLLEREGREPRLGTLVKLAVVLDVSVSTLADGIVWEPPSYERPVPRPEPGRFRAR